MKNYLDFIDKDNLKIFKEEYNLTYDNFIINYKVVSTDFIIKYASGRVETLNYTINLEKKILNRMTNQVVICSNILNSKKIEYLNQDRENFEQIILMMSIIPLLFSFLYFNTINNIAINLAIANIVILIISHIVKNKELKEFNEALEDLDKNNLFLLYKDELLNNLSTNNLTINNIDDLELDDLKKKVKNLTKVKN